MVEWVLLVLQSVKVRKGRQEHNQWPVAATSSPNAGPPPVDIINHQPVGSDTGTTYQCHIMCIGSQHVLWIMWMAHPNQADRPQGSHRVSDGILAANDPGTGSGWQQSKQNWARPALELQRCDEVISNVFIRSQLAAW